MHLPAKVILLALVAAGAAPALASAPVRPTDPEFVVAELPGGASGARRSFALELEESRRDARKAAELAGALLQQARSTMQPQLYGRAESVLLPWVKQAAAPAALLVMEADILQQRHEFAAATELLDTVIARETGDRQARLMRANNAIVTGALERARPDCTWLLGRGDPWTGTVCLAQVLGGTGQRDQARLLLSRLTASTASPDLQAWALAVQADLDSRAGDLPLAEQHLRQAVALAPTNDPARLALADVLAAQAKPREALAVLGGTRPSAAALLRTMELMQAQGLEAARQQALAALKERLAVSAQRQERTHLREEARLALDLAQPATALTLAQDNFALQRETEDVRLLARAATTTGDRAALEAFKQWLTHTRYQDVVVERLLQGRQG